MAFNIIIYILLFIYINFIQNNGFFMPLILWIFVEVLKNV